MNTTSAEKWEQRAREAERHGAILAMAVLQSDLWRNPEDDVRAAVRYLTRWREI